MYVLIFSTTLARNVSHSEKNWARYDKKYVLVFHVEGRRDGQDEANSRFSQFCECALNVSIATLFLLIVMYNVNFQFYVRWSLRGTSVEI